MKELKEYVMRVQGNGLLGLGEIVAPGVALFTEVPKHFDLSKEEFNVALRKLGKVVLR